LADPSQFFSILSDLKYYGNANLGFSISSLNSRGKGVIIEEQEEK
jgi:hypothetical protein